MTTESINFDVIIVGAGPAGLATAIQLANTAKENNNSLEIAILEKGAEVGSHILSGAVIEADALTELLPNWHKQNPPEYTPVTEEQFLWLSEKRALRMPTPPQMHNQGNYIISLSQYCRWLATIAENLGVQIFAGFNAASFIYNKDGTQVVGVTTGEMGIAKDGSHKDSYQAGMQLYAKYTVLAEGARGFLSEQIIDKFKLRPKTSQTYGLGVKELWQIAKPKHQAGLVQHTIGWPLDNKTYGGAFLYFQKPDLLAIGMVVGLNYKNPNMDPYAELQRLKLHPKFHGYFDQGQRIAYGARCITEGGWQALPQLYFPGGILVGCAAGMVNVAKIKGIHNAIRSGVIAAKEIYSGLAEEKSELKSYQTKIHKSQIGKELYAVRNIKPAFKYGLFFGLAYAAIDTYIFHHKTFWTFKQQSDHLKLKPVSTQAKINYPKPDGKITFDKLSAVYLSGTNHEEDQPCHLQIQDLTIAANTNIKLFNSAESNYCPAKVYELLTLPDGNKKIQINAPNCLHCKACDIKDYAQNIKWTLPEAGGGPGYTNM